MAKNTFTVRYEIEDGYMGGSRPQSFRVDEGDINPEMTDVQIEQMLDDMTQEDMLQKVSPNIHNRNEFMDWAKRVVKSMA